MSNLLKTIGGWWNDLSGATQRMQFEEEQADLSRQHDRYMSSTAISRQVEDAKLAGINPAMLYANSSASGAASPSSATARASSASSNPVSSLSSLLNSASNLARSFNHDKDRSNDVTLKDISKTAYVMNKLLDTHKNTAQSSK